jgi:GT2 family glycosyltransferase
MMQKEFGKNKKINFEWHKKNSGVCKARNKGISMSKYPIVINMDQDCIPEKNWLKKMVVPFENPKVGIASAFGYYGGTSTAFRKDLLEKVGGYDESYFYYREDSDLSFKIMDLGYKFVVVKAEYEHDHEMIKPKGLWNLLKYVDKRLKHHMNDVLLYKKHPRLAGKFLDVWLGFLVNPFADFGIVAGTWRNPFDKGNKKKTKWLELSSPQGITFIENKSPLHTLAIFLIGIGFVFAIKFYRLRGSIKHGKLLL